MRLLKRSVGEYFVTRANFCIIHINISFAPRLVAHLKLPGREGKNCITLSMIGWGGNALLPPLQHNDKTYPLARCKVLKMLGVLYVGHGDWVDEDVVLSQDKSKQIVRNYHVIVWGLNSSLRNKFLLSMGSQKKKEEEEDSGSWFLLWSKLWSTVWHWWLNNGVWVGFKLGSHDCDWTWFRLNGYTIAWWVAQLVDWWVSWSEVWESGFISRLTMYLVLDEILYPHKWFRYLAIWSKLMRVDVMICNQYWHWEVWWVEPTHWYGKDWGAIDSAKKKLPFFQCTMDKSSYKHIKQFWTHLRIMHFEIHWTYQSSTWRKTTLTSFSGRLSIMIWNMVSYLLGQGSRKINVIWKPPGKSSPCNSLWHCLRHFFSFLVNPLVSWIWERREGSGGLNKSEAYNSLWPVFFLHWPQDVNYVDVYCFSLSMSNLQHENSPTSNCLNIEWYKRGYSNSVKFSLT